MKVGQCHRLLQITTYSQMDIASLKPVKIKDNVLCVFAKYRPGLTVVLKEPIV